MTYTMCAISLPPPLFRVVRHQISTKLSILDEVEDLSLMLKSNNVRGREEGVHRDCSQYFGLYIIRSTWEGVEGLLVPRVLYLMLGRGAAGLLPVSWTLIPRALYLGRGERHHFQYFGHGYLEYCTLQCVCRFYLACFFRFKPRCRHLI